MSKKDAALKLALDWYDSGNENPDDFANMIKQVIALAQQPAQGCDYCNHPQYVGTKCKNCGREQPAQDEPVAVYVGETWCGSVVRLYDDLPLETPLYTRPQAREPLTDEQIATIRIDEEFDQWGISEAAFKYVARAIEAAHGITGEKK